MSDNIALDQNEIERLLGGMGGSAPPAPPPAPEPASSASGGADDGVLSQDELNALFGGGPDPAPQPAVPAPDTLQPGSTPLDQSELDSLFGGPSKPAAAPPVPPASPITAPVRPAAFVAPPPPPPSFGGGEMDSFDGMDGDDDEEGVPRGDLDYIMKRADDSLRSVGNAPLDLPAEVIEFQFPEFGGTVPSTEHATLDQISEVDLNVKIELGRTDMYLEDVLKLRKGSVVPLDKMAGDAVDIYVNGRLLARGEVLVMNENFCVRVAELLAGAIPME
jgi:flagellar motor switch protein FliN/FliY